MEGQIRWVCQTSLYWYLKLKILVGRASGRAGSRGQDMSSSPFSGSMVAFIVMARWLPAARDLYASSQEHRGKKISLFIQRPVIE